MTDTNASGAPTDQTFRLLPVVTRKGFTRLPLVLMLAYLVATFALFLIWPINWPIYLTSDWVRLIGYVTLCFTAIGSAALIGSSGATRVTAPLPYLNSLLVVGASLAIALLIPSSEAYTGRPAWDLIDALRDQGAAYKRLQIQLFETTGQRTLIAALRALVEPLSYAVLPLGIIYWAVIGWSGRIAMFAVAAASIVFSIMRGTDREIADLFVVGTSAGFVSYARSRLMGQPSSRRIRRLGLMALVVLTCFYLAQGLFTERKAERVGGYANRTAICANNSRICVNIDTPWLSWIPLRERFGVSYFILTTCSGYYGLELALDKPFYSTLGVGHSPAALSLYETVTGDQSTHSRTYTYRNGEDGWPEEFYWSTMITWIANDVGFPGAIAVLALIGFLWGLWWREASAGMSDPAAVLFSLSTTMVVYLPANNQVFASYEGYTTFAVWMGIWLWHRSQRALSAMTPVTEQIH